jgi:phospholipase C
MAGIDPIEHVFVLMLENRAFDHIAGFWHLAGSDAETGQPTMLRGLDGTESNTYKGQTYPVKPKARYVMPVDPGHEFHNVLDQLCGPEATYPRWGPYPEVTRSGFVDSYAKSGGGADPGEIMKCYTTEQLPVLHALANEFVICDNWHASMPGPTWPNRMFVHAGTSGGLDHSPTVPEMVDWVTLSGYEFLNRTIFDLLRERGVTRRLYAGDHFPMVAALKGIGLGDIREYEHFANDLQQGSYPYNYVFIEPSYNILGNYRGSSSQHPRGDIRDGERLIKTTYEAIRNSAHWKDSLLIITWDEHGGFYDHAVPPEATPPGDTWETKYNKHGFTFDRYGPRVPALVISPLIPGGLIDHRLYDHTSILATVEKRFGILGMTNRDRTANDLSPLVKLTQARAAPSTLPEPNQDTTPEEGAVAAVGAEATAADEAETVNNGNLPAIVFAAMQQDLRLSPEKRDAILQRVKSITTVGGAREYMQEVQRKLDSRREGGVVRR